MRAAALLILVGCGEDLRAGLVPYEQLGYQQWRSSFVAGDAPGHAGYRTLYANDLARDGAQDFTLGYQDGAILVKEVWNDAARTDLRHVAIMRRIGPVDTALEDDAGWYFTEAPAGGPEQHFDFCFRRCHVAAPYNGAWFDYRE